MNKPIRRAILDGASQIAVPAFVSTLSICIVFVPVAFLTGPAAYLFVPLAMAVVFAMLASYFLSRTLVPTMVLYLLPAEIQAETRAGSETAVAITRPVWAFLRHPSHLHTLFNHAFGRFRDAYQEMLAGWSITAGFRSRS